MSEDIPNPYELASFRDLRCENAIVVNIQNVINTQANTATFCFSIGGTEINTKVWSGDLLRSDSYSGCVERIPDKIIQMTPC
jgi:hypothetical protein